MPALIESITTLAQMAGGTDIQRDGESLLATFPTTEGRTQTVKVWIERGQYGKYRVVRCQSRACLAKNAARVRQLLQLNAKADWGGFALDTSAQPPTVDMVQGVVVNAETGMNSRALIAMIVNLATSADAIEKQTLGVDVF